MKSTMKVLFTFILCNLILHAVAVADDPCQLGKDALAKRDYLSAINYLKEGVRKDKKNTVCFINLGVAYLGADSADQAVTILIQARELDSTNAKIYELIGDAYAKQGIQSAAIQQYQTAASMDSSNAGLHRKLAYAQLKLRAYPQAIAEFRWVISLDTTDTDAYRNVGHLYYRAEQLEKAAQYLKVVYDRNPKDSLRIEFARALYQTKHYKEFIDVARPITFDDPSQSELLRWLATSYGLMKDSTNASQILEQQGADTLKLKPHEWIERGKLLSYLGQSDKAIAAYERGIQEDSSFKGEVAYELGSLYMKAKQWEKAVSMFEKKLAVDTGSNFKFACHYNAAVSLMQLKNWEDARTHILSSIDARPEYIPAWQSLAECYLQMDSTALGRSAYRRMLGLIDDTEDKDKYKKAAEEGYRTEGFYLLLDKKYPASLENLKKALAIDPANCQTLLWTAQAYTLSNLRDDAKRYYCKVIANCGKGDPRYADAVKGLNALGAAPGDCGK
ncbi:MAG: tetratricopeptide repeat protein [Bacteroidota bacterium]